MQTPLIRETNGSILELGFKVEFVPLDRGFTLYFLLIGFIQLSSHLR